MLKMALFDSAINAKCWSVALSPPPPRPHPEGFDSSRVPTPGNLPSKAKKNAYARGSAWELGGAGRS